MDVETLSSDLLIGNDRAHSLEHPKLVQRRRFLLGAGSVGETIVLQCGGN